MSLLIKALHKAEQEKSAEGKSNSSPTAGLELEPKSADVNLEDEAGLSLDEPVRKTRSPSQSNQTSQDKQQDRQKTAGIVFAAKTDSQNHSTTILIFTGLVLLLIVAGGFYYYLESLKQPEVILPSNIVQVTPTPPADMAAPVTQPMFEESADVAMLDDVAADTNRVDYHVVDPAAQVSETEPPPINEGFTLAPGTNKPGAKAPEASFGEPVARSAAAEVKITRSTPPPAINPNLLQAYEAFNAGDDAAAQAGYRKALQADVRNTDALLGMAAVALRQGRTQDAIGWYGKVLEVEPRNSFAQAAMVNLVGQVDPVAGESRIKNLIALQPDAAHLHAALGSLYAEYNQWPQAQQAYFEAHRLDTSNAEHAFNLAVSLDHIGKPALALEYYKKTLGLMGSSPHAAIDRGALEARIAQLQ